MPMVPPDHDRFRVLREPSPRTPAPPDVGRILRGPNSIAESPELAETFIRNMIGRPVDPLSPHAMFRAHVEKSSGLTPLSLTEGPPPSARDRAVDFITDTLGGNRDLAGRLVAGAEFAIPPVGAVFAANDFGRSIASGDVPGSLIAMVGLAPGKLFTKLGKRPQADVDGPHTLPDGSSFEWQTFTTDLGHSRLKTTVEIREEPTLAHGLGGGEGGLPVATVTFRRIVPPNVRIDELPVEEGVQAIFTVQNNFADFVLPRLAAGKAFRVRFAAQDKELEKFYETVVPRIEAAYGVKPKKRVIETDDGPMPGFILDFPAGHKLPKQ